MPTPIPAGRLDALKAALAEAGPDDWASQKNLAELYGVAPSRLSTLVKTRFKGFPGAERRDDKTHWYPAAAAIGAMIRYMEGTSEERMAQAVRHTAIMSGAKPARAAAEQAAEEAEPPMSASEIDRLVSAQSRLWKLAKDQGQFVAAADVALRARQANALFTRSITSIPSRLDPNGELPTEIRTRLEKECKKIVVDVREAMAEMMGADDEDAEPSGRNGRAGTDNRGRRNSRRG